MCKGVGIDECRTRHYSMEMVKDYEIRRRFGGGGGRFVMKLFVAAGAIVLCAHRKQNAAKRQKCPSGGFGPKTAQKKEHCQNLEGISSSVTRKPGV